jgi:aminoglycoside phosphotransferase (APT) family kinase protein
MTVAKMHEQEFDIDENLVRKLLAKQFPKFAHLPISRIKSSGTDNAIYRLGADICMRLPRVINANAAIEKEQRWLPLLAKSLPLAIPVPLGIGIPQAGYPSHWSIYRWLEGENAIAADIADINQAAFDLARFLTSLQHIDIDISDAPLSQRGYPLSTQDTEVRTALLSLREKIDTEKAQALWEECLQALPWDKNNVWIHGDLLPGNLLIQNKRLIAVIDWGLFGVGDPACDLLAAWSLFSGRARNTFRKACAVDEATWMRGRGWALSIALTILPYYWDTNPELVAVAKRILSEIFIDY